MTTAPDQPRIVHNDDTRSDLYSVAIALGPILIAAGLVSVETWGLYLVRIGTLIQLAGNILAKLNRPKGRRAK